MNRARQAQLITAVVLTALVLLLVTRRPQTNAPVPVSAAPVAVAPTGPTPQDTVYAMLDAARAGNAPAYLHYFDGELAASLRQSAAEQGDARFAQYLKATNEPVKGIEVRDAPGAPAGEARLRVELIYADRNEAQIVHLKQSGADWKIVKLETAARVKTLVPYGTPVE